MSATIAERPGLLLCRLHLHHRWHLESTDDGHQFLRCERCGKDDPRVTEPARWTEGFFGDHDIPLREH